MTKKVISFFLIIFLLFPLLQLFNLTITLKPTSSHLPIASDVTYSHQITNNKQPSSETHFSIGTPKMSPQQIKPGRICLMIYFTGLLMVILFRLIKWFKVMTIIKQSSPLNRQVEFGNDDHTEVLINPEVEIPFVVVLKKNFIVLPQDSLSWSHKQLQFVLVHEMSHVKRKDHWFIWLSIISNTIYWFHPLIFLLNKKLRRNIELGCDIEVINHGYDRYHYARTLVKIATSKEHNSMVAQMGKKSKFMHLRVNNIINNHYQKILIKHRVFLLIGLSIIVLISCIDHNLRRVVPVSEMAVFVNDTIPSIRDGLMSDGDIHIAAIYDGHGDQAFAYIELIDEQNRTSWLQLGPLENFTENLYAWHFKLLDGVSLSGRYALNGVENNGVTDGIALGLIVAENNHQLHISRSQSLVSNMKIPNVVCSWPLAFSPHLSSGKKNNFSGTELDSIKRILCGSQILPNGQYEF